MIKLSDIIKASKKKTTPEKSVTLFKFLSVILLGLLMSWEVKTSDMNGETDWPKQPVLPASFSKPLVSQEIPFIDYCEENEIEVNWQQARESLYKISQREFREFELITHD